MDKMPLDDPGQLQRQVAEKAWPSLGASGWPSLWMMDVKDPIFKKRRGTVYIA